MKRPRLPTRIPWFAAGNQATGFIAVGNVVTGFIAFGNVARGFIAVGNLAVGVIAFGNVGFGLLVGGGATIGVGLFALAGVFALSVLDGVAGVAMPLAASLLTGLLPPFLWFVFSLFMPGKRLRGEAPAPQTTLAALRSGKATHGWLRAKVRGASKEEILLGKEGEPIAAPPEVLHQADALSRGGALPRVWAYVEAQERPADNARLYREAPRMKRVLTCQEIHPIPRGAPFADEAHLQWWLARAWRVGALAGLLSFISRMFF